MKGKRMLVELLTPDFIHQDDRGSLQQLVHDGFKQINVITSKAGTLRGGHYHKQNHEAFYVISGKISLTLSNNEVCETYLFAGDSFFLIRENIVHSFDFVEDTLLVSFYSNGVELANGEKDIYVKEVKI